MERQTDKQPGVLRSLDWWTIAIYMCLLVFGWVSVCGASYTYGDTDIFSLSSRSGMQIVWIGTSICLGFVILMLDDRFYDTFAYVIYAALLLLLFATIFNPHEIKGSRSWLVMGPLRLQPAEFAKFATALAVAKLMSAYGFTMSRWKHFAAATAVVLLPMLFIVGQKETGSALVYLSFFLMFYREGMPGSILFTGVAMVIYFVVGIRYGEVQLWETPTMTGTFVVMLLIQIFTTSMIGIYCRNKREMRMLLYILIGVTAVALLFSKYVIPFNIVWVQVAISLILMIYLIYQGLSSRIRNYYLIAAFCLGSVIFFLSASYILNNVLEVHQRTRINVLLGLEEDLSGAGYNVHQSEIAIGSGGLEGKGFLNGNADQVEICAGTRYRLYILHSRRGGRLSRVCRRAASVPCTHTATDISCRAAAFPFLAHLWLLRAQHLSVPCFHKRGHGARSDTSHRYSPAILQLWRFIPLGLYHSSFHFPTPRCRQKHDKRIEIYV